eukprot:3040162-Amphidinium_carterae.1
MMTWQNATSTSIDCPCLVAPVELCMQAQVLLSSKASALGCRNGGFAAALARCQERIGKSAAWVWEQLFECFAHSLVVCVSCACGTSEDGRIHVLLQAWLRNYWHEVAMSPYHSEATTPVTQTNGNCGAKLQTSA